MELNLSWTPSPDLPYPNTWLRFKARDLDGDNLVEYRICDLPKNRFDDFFNSTALDYLINEPRNSTMGFIDNPESVRILKIQWGAAHKQGLISVCMKDGSDEICGFNILYVNSIEDNVTQQIRKLAVTEEMKKHAELKTLLYGDFTVFKHYNVDRFLASFGLSVSQKYGQRGIGRKLMEARKLIGVAHGLKLTHSSFSSIYSNKLADAVGFKLDREYKWDHWRAANPTAPFSEHFTAKTWILTDGPERP